MSQRRDAIGNYNPDEATGNTDIMDGLYGTGGVTSRTRPDRIKHLNIFDILPDPAQPRRVLPVNVRAKWNKTPEGAQQALLLWLRMANDLYPPGNLSMDTLLDGTQEIERPVDDAGDPMKLHAVVENLINLCVLAREILADGLSNPVHVVKTPGGYMLEQGERRWWVHHLLHHFVDGRDTIKAVVHDEFSIARQASENAAREPLNAIGVTRQLALVIMMLIQQRDGDTGKFMTYEQAVTQTGHELGFYRQIEDYKTPRGQLSVVLDKTGLPSRKVVSAYRKLLTLNPGTWDTADEENWTERSLRRYTQTEDKSPTGNITPETTIAPADIPAQPEYRDPYPVRDNPPAPPPQSAADFLTTADSGTVTPAPVDETRDRAGGDRKPFAADMPEAAPLIPESTREYRMLYMLETIAHEMKSDERGIDTDMVMTWIAEVMVADKTKLTVQRSTMSAKEWEQWKRTAHQAIGTLVDEIHKDAGVILAFIDSQTRGV
ncbi:MAG: hypothetical protein ACPG7F_00825 [Aggregatilineales bacterium]